MQLTFAFDIYGTLIDTSGITQNLRRLVGDQAELFSSRWREKQLEYSFRRGLMGDYVDFSVCTRQALAYTSAQLELPISDSATEELLEAYRHLPAFPEVPLALAKLRDSGHRLYAFSNGVPADLEILLSSAGIRDNFIDLVSVDEIHTFKPDPATYRHFLARSGVPPDRCFLVSSNPFDLLGAMAVSLRSAWIRRSDANHFDPWGKQPELTFTSLTDLQQAFDSPRGT
ncbi:haloacid dehalogenase type II [Sedimenticola thiotaurini]|uniref:(S)-2-haloacid dehalogenase n=1 Tax=Sedimenticola thiotaurini TaxID=1543721 RepID=A0A0F7K181_9GAMM|nr:haloacid dehalogenase type II [Sedimenticola thiotaurini]AKH20940.1 haloacid dehalogenase [Sedimenticola thiotaurini]